jgi:hypothetical protein
MYGSREIGPTETVCYDDCIHPTHCKVQCRLTVNMANIFPVPLKAGNMLTISFSRRALLRGVSYDTGV